MKIFLKAIFVIFVFIVIGVGNISSARENVNEWYIQDFNSKIILNTDSTVKIEERIKADCGNAVGKHGIFRVLPKMLNVKGKNIDMPVELISITDENGRSLKYEEIETKDTVTWKIGDPNVTVQGINYYVIKYKIKNVINFENSQFDEFYWNLNGNYWDLEIDNFSAQIVFPQSISKENSKVEYYTGAKGSKNKSLATYEWIQPNVLHFQSTRKLNPSQGITASVIFPKGIFTPYEFSFFEKYGKYQPFLVPIILFFILFFVWLRFGKDPIVNKTVIAEYDVPENLTPVEMGMIMKSGRFQGNLIAAEMIYLATRGYLKITEKKEKILFFETKDYEIKKITYPEANSDLNKFQKEIMQVIFQNNNIVMLSKLKNDFRKKYSEIRKAAKSMMDESGYYSRTGLMISNFTIFGGFAIMLFLALIFGKFTNSTLAGISSVVSMAILLIFYFLMPKRTKEGAELNRRIKGFKLFMETVDKHRAQFYEKENIFDKYLPYAILFGMTKKWTRKMQEIYGSERIAAHSTTWYIGNSMYNGENFSKEITNLTAGITASTGGSGSGGSGSSGGGGGGGGGGGW